MATSNAARLTACPLCEHSPAQKCNKEGGCVLCDEAGQAAPESPTLMNPSDSKWTCQSCGGIRISKKSDSWIMANEPVDPNKLATTKFGCGKCGPLGPSEALLCQFMDRLQRTNLRRNLGVKDVE